MVDVVRFGNDNYKKCCGNCQYYKPCNYECPNPEHVGCYNKKRNYIKAYVPSDIGCKYFSFIPNKIYDKQDYEVRVVDTVILNNGKYVLFSLAICNHLSKKGESLIKKKDDNTCVCSRCKAKFVLEEK